MERLFIIVNVSFFEFKFRGHCDKFDIPRSLANYAKMMPPKSMNDILSWRAVNS